MTSMTGYAYEEKNFDNALVSVEIKSVNSRFLDLSIYLPPYLNSIESKLRELASKKIFRGKVDINIRIKEMSPESCVKADINAAKSYAQAIGSILKALGRKEDVPLSLIISQPGVLVPDREYDVQLYLDMITEVFEKAVNSFCAFRLKEGENLYKDIISKLSILEQSLNLFKHWQPRMEEMFKEQILRKFKELIGDAVDEQRIMTETAAMLVKYTINEEIIRLESHFCALKIEMAENPAPGKKMDFLCQEINREINTIGSKSQFKEVGAAVISAKDALENIREQAKNIE